MCTHSQAHMHTHPWAERSSRGSWIRSQYEVPPLLNITPVVVTERTQISPKALQPAWLPLPDSDAPVPWSHRPRRGERQTQSLRAKKLDIACSEVHRKTWVFLKGPGPS